MHQKSHRVPNNKSIFVHENVFPNTSRGRKERKCWSLALIVGAKDLSEKRIIKMTINTLTQIRDKTANATQDQAEHEK